jgi:hypothetical protein
MKCPGLILAISAVVLNSCDPHRAMRPITVVVPPDVVQRQSCQSLLSAEQVAEQEVVLYGTAEHGHPDLLRVQCGGQERSLVFFMLPAPEDLGMKELRRAWEKKRTSRCKDYRDCPRYNVRGRFVGAIRSDPAEHSRLLFLVRTADRLRILRIPYPPKK